MTSCFYDGFYDSILFKVLLAESVTEALDRFFAPESRGTSGSPLSAQNRCGMENTFSCLPVAAL